ncbi:MAG: type II toxin-antitoxin system RelE/ParE family toxin [Patescibacteria group bacterium]|nr:type II toxin-antitoxin system RelE/ParE family toxin [Patescibacteria group bacterium]MCL5224246.1 type II toxin-antitoxin system RelE/ParE family toxin [Patescibacteria group bacterium]
MPFSEVTGYVEGLPAKDAAKVLAHLNALENGWTEELAIKPLKGKVMELTVGPYRIVYFKHKETIYAVDVFRKKSQKTPPRIIHRAEQIYLAVTNDQKKQ